MCVPLLQDVTQLIRDKKSKKMGNKQAESILPLKVRGKVLWFLKSHKCVSLALREGKAKNQDVDQEEVQGEREGEGQAITDLRWFLSELSKDVLSMQQEPAGGPPTTSAKAPRRGRPATGPAAPDLQDFVKTTLELLRKDPGCKTVGYHPSKLQFSVVRKEDSARKNIRLLCLKRKREAAASSDSRDLQGAFDEICSGSEGLDGRRCSS